MDYFGGVSGGTGFVYLCNETNGTECRGAMRWSLSYLPRGLPLPFLPLLLLLLFPLGDGLLPSRDLPLDLPRDAPRDEPRDDMSCEELWEEMLRGVSERTKAKIGKETRRSERGSRGDLRECR